MKNNKLIGTSLLYVCGIILILMLMIPIFNLTPTKEIVDNFFQINRNTNVIWCNPQDTDITNNDEYSCAYYLRKHTAIFFGKILNVQTFPFSAMNPFGYFYYETSEENYHNYVFIATRDKGLLVYNPVNGQYIGKYTELTKEMGCQIEKDTIPLFSGQIRKSKFDKLNMKCFLVQMYLNN